MRSMVEGAGTSAESYDYDEDRETLLCLLLENVGADRVVQFGNPDVWRRAVAKL